MADGGSELAGPNPQNQNEAANATSKGGQMSYKVSSLPASYVRTLGANGASVLYGFARSIKNRKRSFRKGKCVTYVIDKLPAISYPIGKRSKGEAPLVGNYLSNSQPWISSETYRRKVARCKGMGLIKTSCNPHGRYSTNLGKTVRNPDLYTMDQETIDMVLDTRQLLHFSEDDACKFGLNTALVINRAYYLFEMQRRDNPEAKTLRLVPKELAKHLKIKPSTIRDAIACMLAPVDKGGAGILRKANGERSSEYDLIGENPLANKEFKKIAPPKAYKAPDGMTPEQVNIALVQMQEDLAYWYAEKTGQVTGPEDEIHFKKAAEICFHEHYNPNRYVARNLGAANRNRKPQFLHGSNSEAKYLSRYAFRVEDVESDRQTIWHEISGAKWSIDFALKHKSYRTLEEMLLDESSKLPAWYRVVGCPADSGMLLEVMKKFVVRGRREIQEMSRGVEALFYMKDIDASRLFPYYRQYFDDAPIVPKVPNSSAEEWYLQAMEQETGKPHILREVKWEVGSGYRYFDDNGQEKYCRPLLLALSS